MSSDLTSSDRRPVVVLLHGIPGSARAWGPVTERLGACEVIAPDLVGFGPAAAVAPIDALRADAQAVEIAELLDRRGVRGAVLVGHDFGGPVGLHLLEQRPDLVGALVLLASNTFPDTAVPLPLRPIAWGRVGRWYARIAFAPVSLRAMTSAMVGRPKVRLDSSTYVGSSVQARSIRLIFTDALAHLAERYARFPAVMADTAVPVTVLWGDRDPFFTLAHGRRTAEAFSAARFVAMPGAGHALPEERPDDVANEILTAVASMAPTHGRGRSR